MENFLPLFCKVRAILLQCINSLQKKKKKSFWVSRLLNGLGRVVIYTVKSIDKGGEGLKHIQD